MLEFIETLRKRGVSISARGDDLVIRAPLGTVDETLRAEIAERKALLLTFLARQSEEDAAAGVAGDAPLSFAQERLWFMQRLEARGAAFNSALAFRLRGPLDEEALFRALGTVQGRHDVLRSRIVDGPDGPLQRIDPEMPLPVTVIDLSTSGAPEAEAMRRARALARHRFDLAAEAWWTGELIRLGQNDRLFVVAFHHIACDGWSTGIFIDELSAAYRASGEVDAAPLPRLEISYGRYAAWERDPARTPVLREQIAYWNERLANLPPVLAPPPDREAAPAEAAQERLEATAGNLARRVEALAAESGATPFMVYLAGMAALQRRHVQLDDIVIGIPVPNRNLPGAETLIGTFVNMLALRLVVTDGMTLPELLAEVRTATLAAFDRQDAPFDQVVREMSPDRDGARQPLFRTVLALHDLRYRKLVIAGIEAVPVSLAVEPIFDLTLSIERDDSGVRLSIDHDPKVYSARRATTLLAHYVHLLDHWLSHLATAVRDLPLAAAEEERRLVQTAATGRAPAGLIPATRLFAQQVMTRPEAVAVLAGGAQLTYGAFDARTGALAAEIAARGIGEEDIVAILAPPSLDYLTAMFATLRVGAAFAPLDPARPDGQLAEMLDAVGPRLVVASPDQAARAALEGHPVLELGSLQEPPKGAPDWPAPDLRALGYAICTSGTTGTPKVVLLEHSALANLAAWSERAFGIGPGQRTTLASAPGFDAAVWDAMAALCNGATLCIPPAHIRAAPSSLAGWLALEQVTTSFLPTPLAEAILQGRAPPRSLTRLLTGGDRLRSRPASDQTIRLYNNYGPTENGVVSTSNHEPVAPGGDDMPPPSIGAAIDGTFAVPLDERLAVQPPGVGAELHVGGAGLARGYGGAPAPTAAAFIPDAWSGRPGERVFRTGDLVRWREDGAFDFIGRNDDRIKLRGLRLEPAEVERCLCSHPAVRDAAVAVRENASGDPILVAYLVGLGARPDIADVRRHIASRLPAALAPALYMVIGKMPQTVSGKVDRAALPAPADERPEGAQSVPPRSDAERVVAQVWAQVLKAPSIGIHDNFFDLGGHSLMLARVQDLLCEAFGRKIEMVDLFNFPTIAALGARLAEAEGAGGGADRLDEADARAARRRSGLGKLATSRRTERGATNGPAP